VGTNGTAKGVGFCVVVGTAGDTTVKVFESVVVVFVVVIAVVSVLVTVGVWELVELVVGEVVAVLLLVVVSVDNDVVVAEMVVLMLVLVLLVVVLLPLPLMLLLEVIARFGCIVTGAMVTTPGSFTLVVVVTTFVVVVVIVVVVLVSVDGVVVVGFGMEWSPSDSACRYTNSSFAMAPSPSMSTNRKVSRAMA